MLAQHVSIFYCALIVRALRGELWVEWLCRRCEMPGLARGGFVSLLRVSAALLCSADMPQGSATWREGTSSLETKAQNELAEFLLLCMPQCQGQTHLWGWALSIFSFSAFQLCFTASTNSTIERRISWTLLCAIVAQPFGMTLPHSPVQPHLAFFHLCVLHVWLVACYTSAHCIFR